MKNTNSEIIARSALGVIDKTLRPHVLETYRMTTLSVIAKKARLNPVTYDQVQGTDGCTGLTEGQEYIHHRPICRMRVEQCQLAVRSEKKTMKN